MPSKTEQIIIEQYGALMLTMDQLAKCMQLDKRSLQNMISAGRCPINTVGKGKLRRAPIANVAKWIDGN